MAADALDLDEIAGAKVPIPRIVERSHLAIRVDCVPLSSLIVRSGECKVGLMIYSFANALPAVIEDRKHHTREATRLLSLAPTITTPAVKARVLEQAEEHARRAELVSEGGVRDG